MENKTTKKQTTVKQAQVMPERWVDEHGSVLYTYAFLRVREHGLAEDLVQDTFLAGLKSSRQFQGRSSERTWLVAILKHKIIDFFRKSSRNDLISVADFHDKTQEESASHDGSWLTESSPWVSEPRKALEQKEFLAFFQQSLASLPSKLSQVFILHELDGLNGNEICDILNITSSNLWVMLFRARMALKEKLGPLLVDDITSIKSSGKTKNSRQKPALSYAPIKST